jgi:hypothetical protein
MDFFTNPAMAEHGSINVVEQLSCDPVFDDID